jgi:hypothetical protein
MMKCNNKPKFYPIVNKLLVKAVHSERKGDQKKEIQNTGSISEKANLLHIVYSREKAQFRNALQRNCKKSLRKKERRERSREGLALFSASKSFTESLMRSEPREIPIVIVS